LDQLYTQVYRDNYGVLMAFHRDELAVPQELQVAAEVALSHRALLSLRALEQESSDLSAEASPLGLSHLSELEAIATEASLLRCHLNLPEARQTLERMILRSLWQILHNFDPATLKSDLHRLERLINLGQHMNLNLSLAQAQELYYHRLHGWIIPQSICQSAQETEEMGQTATAIANKIKPVVEADHLLLLLQLGQKLAVEVSGVL
ncbi:MAG: glycoside hydrolase, partial [Kovacikia sp.]